MIKGLMMAGVAGLAYLIIRLIFGKDGMQLREKQGKSNKGLIIGIMLLLIFWGMSVLLLVSGSAAKDTILCIVVAVAIPIILIIIGIRVRKGIRETLEKEANNPQSPANETVETNEEEKVDPVPESDIIAPVLEEEKEQDPQFLTHNIDNDDLVQADEPDSSPATLVEQTNEADSSKDLLFCRYCGFKLLDDSDFCSHCGKRVR